MSFRTISEPLLECSDRRSDNQTQPTSRCRVWRPALRVGRKAVRRPAGRAVEPVPQEQAPSRRGWRRRENGSASALGRAAGCCPRPTPLRIQGLGRPRCGTTARWTTPVPVWHRWGGTCCGRRCSSAQGPAHERPGLQRTLLEFAASASWRGPSPTWRAATRSRRRTWPRPSNTGPEDRRDGARRLRSGGCGHGNQDGPRSSIGREGKPEAG
jgi:hypothetical protein